MDLQVTEKESGESFKLSDIGITVKDFHPSEIDFDEYIETIQGVDGVQYGGMDYRRRTIDVPYYFIAERLLDVPLTRDDIFHYLMRKEELYLREMRRPRRKQYAFAGINEEPSQEAQTDDVMVGGKRYLARYETITVNQEDTHDGLKVTGTITFITTELPFAESIETTKRIVDDGGIDLNTGAWSFGMNLPDEPEDLQYEFNGSGTHRFFNSSSIPVNFFHHDARIVLTANAAAAGFTIEDTFGNELIVQRDLVQGDEIIIENAMVKVNGLNATNDVSRKQFPILRLGFNEIVLSGADLSTLYDFRFYYL